MMRRWTFCEAVRVVGLAFLLVVAAEQGRAATDKYRLSWRADPATTMVVGWNQISGADAAVHFGPDDHGADYAKYPHRQGPDVIRFYRGMVHYFARLRGLAPDTAYHFVIRDSDSVSSPSWFRTAPNREQPLTCIIGGDTRTNAAPRRDGNRLVAKLRPLFVAHGGDYMNWGNEQDWQTWLDDWQLTRSDDGRMYPIVATHGNHENADLQMVHAIFDTPNPDMYYALSVGGVMLRLYTLNTELTYFPERWAAQKAWVRADLELNSRTTWKIVNYHRPMRAHTTWKAEGLMQIEAWAQTFYDNWVDLVVECDTHLVKRTYPIRPSNEPGSHESFIRDDLHGTVYVGEGSWGAPQRPLNDSKPWAMAGGSFWQFKWLHVYPGHIDLRCVKIENVDAVGANSEENVFAIPENLSIWEPPSGAVLRLPYAVPKASPPDWNEWEAGGRGAAERR